MKIHLDIDVTPEEMRDFLGLPQVKSLQDEMMEEVRRRMHEGMSGLDPLSLMKPFLAPNLQTMESMQRAFWDAFTGAGKSEQPDPKK